MVSAELKQPPTLLRILRKTVDLGPKEAPKPDEAKPKIPGAVPTNQHKPIPTNFGPDPGCVHHDPKLLNSAKTNPTHAKCHRHRAGPFSRLRLLLGRIFPMSVGFDRENGPARCRWHLVWVGLVFAEKLRDSSVEWRCAAIATTAARNSS